MEKILIIGCQNAMGEVCIACTKCLVAFNRRKGQFERYKDAEVVGLLSCGGCPGAVIITRLSQSHLWNKPMGEMPTAVHIAPCIGDHCPYADDIMTKIKVKCAVPVIEGTHSFVPTGIFGK
jgi:predicted metal-binding protein